MPTYDYKCPDCGHIDEVIHSIKQSPSVECSRCKKSGKSISMMRLISPNVGGFIFKTWTPALSHKRSQEQMRKRKKLGTRQLDRYGSGPKIKPNVGGIETESWSDAKKLAKEKGLNTSSYDAAIAREKNTSKISGIDDRAWKKAKSEAD